MKHKVEVVANALVILVAVIVGSVVLKDRFFSPPPQTNKVKTGERLASLDGWDFGAHDQTLILVLRKGCHFCEDSAPFYQRVLTSQQKHTYTAIIAVFPDAAETVNNVVRSEGLDVPTLAGVPLESLKVSGTPTLLLIDRSGIVLNEWTGVLSPRQELEVMRAMACHDKNCREPS